ncbi:MAG: tripartite tricarboxylate transporter TctB family protein [Ideonella sp.]
MRHIEYRDLTAGVLLGGVGLFTALYGASHYTIGDPARMGPGFFPVMLGGVLVVLGVIIVLLAFRKTVHALHPPPFALRALLAVSLSILVFSLLVNSLGLVPATIAMTFVAVAAETPYKLRRTAILSVSLALIAWLIFTVALSMTLPAFTFLG